MGSTVPCIDAGARQRLTARFGDEVAPWLDELPGVLRTLAARWQFQLGPPIPRGSMSVVLRCRMADGRDAVLKASPDRARLADEAAALEGWHTGHTPAVLALDEQLGALLLEAIEPGTPLAVSSAYPDLERVAELLRSLHTSSVPDPSYPTVAHHVAYLFDSSMKLYQRHPELTALIPPELYERGRRLATQLAQDASPIVLLHGDLTPSNLLDGGAERGGWWRSTPHLAWATRRSTRSTCSAGTPTTSGRSRRAPSGWPPRPAPTQRGCLAGVLRLPA
jgi:streptomycin 6-kinase